MSGLVDNHPLARDLPEYKEQIHNLKQSHAHFSNLLKRYEALDKEVVRIEQGLEHLTDLELKGLKSSRARLKDELFDFIRKHA